LTLILIYLYQLVFNWVMNKKAIDLLVNGF
ncbi:MAG: hypothetical protein ACI9Q4_002714, partial [Sediminicola sp.]